jgi:hypothetical protein
MGWVGLAVAVGMLAVPGAAFHLWSRRCARLWVEGEPYRRWLLKMDRAERAEGTQPAQSRRPATEAYSHAQRVSVGGSAHGSAGAGRPPTALAEHRPGTP